MFTGLLRRSLQLFVVLYVGLYQLWYAQGYQEFSSVESSTTTKVITARKDCYNLKPWPLASLALVALILLDLDNWENLEGADSRAPD